jgi:hypothetical protein
VWANAGSSVAVEPRLGNRPTAPPGNASGASPW